MPKGLSLEPTPVVSEPELDTYQTGPKYDGGVVMASEVLPYAPILTLPPFGKGSLE